MSRALELARRGMGATPPNPPVGAVIVRDGRTIGEGFHRAAGEPHAEAEALAQVRARGIDPAGATLYVTLEPCDHHCRTPPCSAALVEARIARAVVGCADPNPKTSGAGFARLRSAGITIEALDDARARELVERFARSIASPYPFVTLKMAASLDGRLSPGPGRYAVTGGPARELVRELRAAHDAVLVGAGTVRVDDPLLTVRPHRSRRRPYVRAIACETEPVAAEHAIFAPPAAPPGAYRRTLVLAPAGKRERFSALTAVADVIFVGDDGMQTLDLREAMRALRIAGITSVLCEGGPTLAGGLLAAGLVDRLVWHLAPKLLTSDRAVPALAGSDVTRYAGGWQFDRVERAGDDVVLSGRLAVTA